MFASLHILHLLAPNNGLHELFCVKYVAFFFFLGFEKSVFRILYLHFPNIFWSCQYHPGREPCSRGRAHGVKTAERGGQTGR